MYKNGMKNFFKNMLYIFVPMGIIYFFLIFTTYGAVENFIKIIEKMFGDIFVLIDKSVEGSGTAIQEFIDYSIAQIDWSQDFGTVIKEILNTEWLQNTVIGFLQTLDISVEGFTTGFNEIIQTFISSAIGILIVAVVICALGIVLADFVTGIVVRRKTAKRNIKQKILHLVLEPLLSASISVALFFLTITIKGYVILVFAAGAIVYEVFTLILAWLIHKDKTVKLKDVITPANIMLNIAVAATIIAIDIAVFLLLYLINIFVAVLIIVPILIYSFKIIDHNSESYVKSLLNKE